MGLRPTAQEKIVNTLIKLKGSELAESTLRRVSYELSRLAEYCDLGNADAVNNGIANMKGSKSYKRRIRQDLRLLCQTRWLNMGVTAVPPRALEDEFRGLDEQSIDRKERTSV